VRRALPVRRGGRVRSPARVGIVGCGVISRHYAENAAAFDSFDLIACADVAPAQADELAKAAGIAAVSVDEIVADPPTDAVRNLTPRLRAVRVMRGTLAATKHVYTEKPIGTTAPEAVELVAEADQRGVRIGCAPDIFLGGAYQAGRALIDSGSIGEPIS